MTPPPPPGVIIMAYRGSASDPCRVDSVSFITLFMATEASEWLRVLNDALAETMSHSMLSVYYVGYWRNGQVKL